MSSSKKYSNGTIVILPSFHAISQIHVLKNPGWVDKMDNYAGKKGKVVDIKNTRDFIYVEYLDSPNRLGHWYAKEWLDLVNKSLPSAVPHNPKYNHIYKKLEQMAAKRKAQGYAY